MGLDVGGFNPRPDWPSFGPSLLIASSLILAIRTTKWAAESGGTVSAPELDAEVAYAVRLAGSVLSMLVTHRPDFFPQVREPWYKPNEDEVQR